MSHFAQGTWNISPNSAEWGPLARFEVIGAAAAIAQTTLFTASRAGWYRVDASSSTLVVGTGAGQTWDLDLEINPAAAQTTANFLNGTDALTQGSTKVGSTLSYLPAGGTVKYTTNSNGTVTTAPTLALGISVTAI